MEELWSYLYLFFLFFFYFFILYFEKVILSFIQQSEIFVLKIYPAIKILLNTYNICAGNISCHKNDLHLVFYFIFGYGALKFEIYHGIYISELEASILLSNWGKQLPLTWHALCYVIKHQGRQIKITEIKEDLLHR